MKAILIDDEPLARSILKEYLSSFPQIKVIEECNDGFEGMKAILHHQPDLIFLDIQMPKINGFEMLELLDTPPAVIFTTAFEEYAIKAFEAHAVDYLLKPFNRDRFNKAMEKLMQASSLNKYNKIRKTEDLLEAAAYSPLQQERIVVKTGTKIQVIPIADIIYLAAADDYVNIYTTYGEFLKNRTMQFFEKTLNPNQFVRIHRSFIVNVQQIVRIDPYEKETHVALLKSGDKVLISKTGYVKLKSVLGI